MTSPRLVRFSSDAPHMTEEEARAIQESFIREHGLDEGEVSTKINAAAQLLLQGDHRGAVRAYSAIAEQHPEERGTCESQIGAAYYFLGEYERAVTFYESAAQHGADEDMMNDNIEEAREAIEKKANGEDPSADSGGGVSPLTLILGVIVVAAILYFVF